MKSWSELELENFLAAHPSFRILELNDLKIELSGNYNLNARYAGANLINRSFKLKFICTSNYPTILPIVSDEDNYFPRNPEHHTYKDGSFCLGSELKIKSILKSDKSITAFFKRIVDPFLYAVSHRIEYNSYPFGDLAHGEAGLIDDYSQMFGVQGKKSVLLALKALGYRKRLANKLVCPCGCKKRLGLCDYRFTLDGFRNLERRRWFRNHLNNSFSPIKRPKKPKQSTQ